MNYKKYLDKKKFSKNTQEAYISDKKHFEVFLENKNINDSEKSDIIKYIIFLNNNNYSESSVARKIASLKSYFYYAINMGLIERDPTFNIEPIKVKKINKEEPLEEELIMSFIKMPLTLRGYDFKGMRDSIIFKTIYQTGINLTDLLNKKIDDINLDIGYLSYNKAYIYLEENLIELYRKYIPLIKDLYPKNEFLFINKNGDKLTRQGVWKIFKNYSEEMELDKDITAQVLINNHLYYN